MTQNNITIGKELPKSIVEVIKVLDKNIRIDVFAQYKHVGTSSTLNAVTLGYKNHVIKGGHIPMILEILKLATPIATEYRKTLSRGIKAAKELGKPQAA